MIIAGLVILASSVAATECAPPEQEFTGRPPAFSYGHVGRYVSQNAPCARLDLGISQDEPKTLQLTVFVDGEAFSSSVVVAPMDSSASSYLEDLTGNLRGASRVTTRPGGCDSLNVSIYIDGAQPIPPGSVFVRYVSIPAKC